MELNENLQAEIAAIFKSVQYGKITFAISPEKKTLDYTVETTGKLPIPQQQRSIKKQISIKKRLTARVIERTVKT